MSRPALLALLIALPAAAQPLVQSDEGVIRQGERELSHRELYELANRPDLVQQSDANRARRKWLAIAAGVSAAALLGSGVAVELTTPNLASKYCESSVERYNNECVPQQRLHVVLGGALIVGGLLAGGLLASFAYWARPEVLTRYETEQLISEYNAAHAPPPPSPPSVRLLPLLGPGLAGLAVGGRF